MLTAHCSLLFTAVSSSQGDSPLPGSYYIYRRIIVVLLGTACTEIVGGSSCNMPCRRRPVPSTAAAAVAGVLWAAAALSGALGAQSADSKYDSGTTVFSPKGRLYQVEYAAEVWYIIVVRVPVQVPSNKLLCVHLCLVPVTSR